MPSTSNWLSNSPHAVWTVLVLASSLAGCQAPARQIDPPACRASTRAGQDWTTQASQRAITFDGLLADVKAREGPWIDCVGDPLDPADREAAFGRLRFTFPSGVTLTFESAPPETGIVTVRRPEGLAPEQEWIGLLKRYAAGRGVPVNWSRQKLAKNKEGSQSESYEADDPGLNAIAVLQRNATGLLVGMKLSLAL